ncbi:large conductance mechanosensitive channel [Paramicrobacterium agarici]|uniref:Large-conductance mechanosensitive channel n=2 Tax=Paramicrobacterium agarici TaxID=630514 RepID=A0A2A9DXF6_9MICO|nr:large-conductance mechanosensitive channel protein MscL [Microbacterium agarici]PFG30815.1 large conductance mechanosensitive channel [Microbacterium agarici]
MLKGFKEFIMRGNVMDLAVAVVVGAAFTAVVTSLVDNLINPLVGLLFKAESLNNALVLEVAGAQFKFGAVIGAIISFLIVAAVVYFVFVLPVNTLRTRAEERRNAGVVDEEGPVTELDVLTEIRDLLQQDTTKDSGTGKHV